MIMIRHGKLLTRNSPAYTEENHEKPDVTVSNQGEIPPEYKSTALALHQTYIKWYNFVIEGSDSNFGVGCPG
jgi:hypothetical protein